eukprot:304269-Heterocapsa_arctica.AAC.1
MGRLPSVRPGVRVPVRRDPARVSSSNLWGPVPPSLCGVWVSLWRGVEDCRPEGAAGCDRVLVRLPKCRKSCPCECGPCVLHGERDLDCARLD